MTGGPALFTQVRVGKDGRVFRIYKFRTMVVDAEQRRAQLLASNDSDGVLFKLRKDPAGHGGGGAPAALVDRRAAAAFQRAPRRHVAGGAAPGCPGRGGGDMPIMSAAGSWSSRA